MNEVNFINVVIRLSIDIANWEGSCVAVLLVHILTSSMVCVDEKFYILSVMNGI